MGGPPPGDEADRRTRRVLWAMPTGLFVIGSRWGDERNLMPANLVVQVATEPRVVAAAVETGSVTRRLVEAGGAFTVSLVRREDRTVVRRLVKPVTEVSVDAAGTGTMAGVAVRAAASGLPVLAGAAAHLDCRLVGRHDFASHVLFLGEVTDAAFGDDGEDTPVLRMEDTRMHYGG